MTIFISYRRSDSPDVSGRIYDELASHFGDEMVFKDVDDIPLGVNFSHFLDDIAQQSSVMLVVIGSRWLDVTNERGQRRLDLPDDFVRMEIKTALDRKIPIIPLLVQGTSMPQQSELPEELAPLSLHNGTPIRSDPDFHWDMGRLIRQLERYVRPADTASMVQRAAPLGRAARVQVDKAQAAQEGAPFRRRLPRWVSSVGGPIAGGFVMLVIVVIVVLQSGTFEGIRRRATPTSADAIVAATNTPRSPVATPTPPPITPSPPPTAPLPTPTASPPTPTPTSMPTPTPTSMPTPTPTRVPPTPTATLTPTGLPDTMIDDFERYGSDGDLQNIYGVNVGWVNVGRLGLAPPPNVFQGRWSAALTYEIKHSEIDYVGFERTQVPHDWHGHRGIRVWIKSLGSGSGLVVQFREAGGEVWQYRMDLSGYDAQELWIPFDEGSLVVGEDPDWNGQIDLVAIDQYGFYVHGDQGAKGTIWVDDFRLIR